MWLFSTFLLPFLPWFAALELLSFPRHIIFYPSHRCHCSFPTFSAQVAKDRKLTWRPRTYRIRLIFSIADIQTEPEDLEGAEGEEAEQTASDFPIRVSVSITKVRPPSPQRFQ